MHEKIGSWTVRWNCDMEALAKDIDGLKWFVGIHGNEIVAQFWFTENGFKVAHGEGYAVQVDAENKTVTIIEGK